jgi:hypothetical protein
MMGADSDQIPEGWYPDPDELEVERYWNGQMWTEKVRSVASVAARGDSHYEGGSNRADVKIVGRSIECEHRLLDPTVSSYHANVLRTADGFVVIDLGSSNGTFVNGIRVQESVIQDEDEVYFGLCRTVFRGGTFVEVSAER